MLPDRRPPSRVRERQLRDLGRDVARHVAPFSAFWAPRLERAGLATGAVRGAEVLDRLAPVVLDEVDDPRDLVLRPDERTLQRHAPPGLLARIAWAKIRRRTDDLNRTAIDPVYKPIQWHVANGVPFGSSSHDVERLATLGRQALALAGVRRYDVLVSLLPSGPNLGYWQLVLGTRRALVSSLFLSPSAGAAEVEAADPAVLAGRADDLATVLAGARRDGRALAGLHTLLVVGEPLPEWRRRALRALLPNTGAAIVSLWSPPGARALWAECRGGEAYHTWPDTEIVESRDGELIWTSLGWKGSVLLRLRTGVRGRVDVAPCPVCGRTTPRVVLAPTRPPVELILDAAPAVRAWQAELREVDGVEELLVFCALDVDGHPGPVLRALDRDLDVTQFVVLPVEEVAARVAAHDGRRVVDLRPTPGRERAIRS